jgi:DNA-binding ferritin-like protein
MKKIIRLTESDLTRIVRQTINENVNQTAEELRTASRRVLSALDDYNTENRKGDNRKIEESKDVVKHHIRRMENILDELKRKLR